jgi:hypothetical protein
MIMSGLEARDPYERHWSGALPAENLHRWERATMVALMVVAAIRRLPRQRAP